MSDSIRKRCAVHRPDTGGTYCVDCGWGLVTAFYSDPVGDDGNVIAEATLTVTYCSWGDPVAVKVPFDELGIDEDTPTIRVREEDFPA